MTNTGNTGRTVLGHRPILRDTRHFRHFRRFPGSEEQTPPDQGLEGQGLVLVGRMQTCDFCHFRQTTCFHQGAKTLFLLRVSFSLTAYSLQLDLVQLELCTRCLAQASELVTQK